MIQRPSWTWKTILVLCVRVLHAVTALGVEDAVYQVAFEQLLRSGELELHSEDDHINRQTHVPDGIDTNTRDPSSAWSYEPICTEYLSRLQSELCVYTDESFGNGRGISIFTTPQLAQEFAFLLPKNDPASPGSHDAKMNSSSSTWYTQETPHKGIGMFAKHDLNRGDLITASTPVLLAYKEDILPKREREKSLHEAVTRLPPSTGDAYRALATMYHDPAFLLQDIASANSFEMIVTGTAHLAVIPEPSRMNHDCAPNAIFVVNCTALTHTVRAARAIMKDEEITIAYTNPLEPFAQRQKYLSTAFGFSCSCNRCQRGESGDAILAEIALLQQSLSTWADPTSTASTKQAERLLRIHREEGLEGYLDPAYCLAALMYNSVGSERGAMKYVKLCIEGVELRLGMGAADLPQWKEMLEDPRGHWSWMRRKRG